MEMLSFCLHLNIRSLDLSKFKESLLAISHSEVDFRSQFKIVSILTFYLHSKSITLSSLVYYVIDEFKMTKRIFSADEVTHFIQECETEDDLLNSALAKICSVTEKSVEETEPERRR